MMKEVIKVRVLLVDDHPLVRKGIKSILQTDPNFTSIIEASNYEQGINNIKNFRPDIVLVDLYMGDKSGFDLISYCQNVYPNTKYVVLTSSVKKEDYIKAKALKVNGYILKTAFPEDVIYGLNTILRGRIYIDSEILLMEGDFTGVKLLSKREIDVYNKIILGFSNKKIAEELFISQSTVKKHVSNILYKLGYNQRTEIIINANKVV